MNLINIFLNLFRDLIKDVSVTLVPLPHMDKIDIADVDKTNKKVKIND